MMTIDNLTKILFLAAAFVSCSGLFDSPETTAPAPAPASSVPNRFDAVSGGSARGSGGPFVIIIGGRSVEEPVIFMASLRSPAGSHLCGGTLIHPKVVLTAAHCVDNGFKPDVHLGRLHSEGSDATSGFDAHKTDVVIVHEKYKDSRGYDIALLVLESASKRDLVTLAASDDCFEEQGGCRVQLLGWGITDDGTPADILQEAVTTSVSRSDCEELHGKHKITETMICAGEIEVGGIDTCQGDSGGPIMQNGKEVGITSWGAGCANAQSPGVYESVPVLRPWINFKLLLIDQKLPLDSDPCDCAKDGVSNRIPTNRLGCKQHLVEDGDSDVFCMTLGGMACPDAKPSEAFLGAAWILCD